MSPGTTLAGALLGALLLGGTYDGDPEPGSRGTGSPLVVFTKAHPLSEAKPDKALVYVVRPADFGAAVKSFFFCDDDALGINMAGTYFFAPLLPGRHVFWSDADDVKMLELNVEAGQVYYIEQHVDPGAIPARTRLEFLDDMTGKETLARCRKQGAITDNGRAKGRELVRQHQKALEDHLP